jgi:hypothetical protein
MSPTQTVRFIRDANGARVAYATVGEGPLILCPAWWVSHVERDWEHPGFRHFFTRLAEGFRVVRYDRPGSGLSDRDVPPRTQACVVQLLATLADCARRFPVLDVRRVVRGAGRAHLCLGASRPHPPTVPLRLICKWFGRGHAGVVRCPCRSCNGPLGLRVDGAIGNIYARRVGPGN